METIITHLNRGRRRIHIIINKNHHHNHNHRNVLESYKNRKVKAEEW